MRMFGLFLYFYFPFQWCVVYVFILLTFVRFAAAFRFTNFFNHLDSFNDNHFLYVTSGGISAASWPAQKQDDKAQSEQPQPQTQAQAQAHGQASQGKQQQQEQEKLQQAANAVTGEHRDAGAVMAEVESESEAEVVDNGEDGG